MSKYKKYLIAVIIVISLSGNLFFAMQLRSLKNDVSTSSAVISARVESSIRDTMLAARDLKETGAKEEMIDLQRSIQQLVSTFNNWIDLNQTENNPNEPLMRGLKALETLRNTVVHHLSNQYGSRNEELTDYDIALLDKVYEQLDIFLVVYGNIQGRVNEIRNPDNSDGGLGQWASNVREISRLYRHSRIPNNHPQYIGLGPAITSIYRVFPELDHMLKSNTIKEDIKKDVRIQDGVHYYEIGYYTGEDLAYSIWIDAIDGSLRQFEDYTIDTDEVLISEDRALSTAKRFMSKFVQYDEVIDGVSSVIDESTKNTVYAFQFIPVLEDITVMSDRVKVNVSAQGGKVLKYSNNFSGTIIPTIEAIVDLDMIEEKYNDLLSDMEYIGKSVVRSFYTHYRPVVTYNYQSTEKEETKKLYFDIATGNQVYEAYSVYEPVSYVLINNLYP